MNQDRDVGEATICGEVQMGKRDAGISAYFRLLSTFIMLFSDLSITD